MSGVNKAILIGRVTSDPETRSTQNGQVSNLTLVTNKKWKNEERSEFHRLVFFNKLSEIIDQWVKKGDQLYVEGEIQTRSYEKDGVKRYSTEIIANQISFLGSPKAHADGNTAPPKPAEGNVAPPKPTTEEPSYDDIPF